MLRAAWDKWIAFSEILGTYVGNSILTVFYFSLFAIPGIVFSTVVDIVGKKGRKDTYYSEDVKDLQLQSLEDAREI